MMRRKVALVAAALLMAASAFGQAPVSKTSPGQSSKLAALNAQHRQAKSQLPKEQQAQLDRLAEKVKARLFAEPSSPDLQKSATQFVHEIVPGLTDVEAEGMADYVLAAIASSTSAAAETQMSFNLGYLRLQSQMQAENRNYTMISNVLKTKHDTVENPIGNVR